MRKLMVITLVYNAPQPVSGRAIDIPCSSQSVMSTFTGNSSDYGKTQAIFMVKQNQNFPETYILLG